MTIQPAMSPDRIISRHPEVVSGALVFAGTRVAVQRLIDYLSPGETLDRFLDGFPTVSRQQAEAYLELTLDEAPGRSFVHQPIGPMSITSASPKERARRAVESSPEEASLEDIIARLIVVHKVERGLAEIRAGEGLMTQAEVEAHFARRRAEREA